MASAPAISLPAISSIRATIDKFPLQWPPHGLAYECKPRIGLSLHGQCGLWTKRASAHRLLRRRKEVSKSSFEIAAGDADHSNTIRAQDESQTPSLDLGLQPAELNAVKANEKPKSRRKGRRAQKHPPGAENLPEAVSFAGSETEQSHTKLGTQEHSSGRRKRLNKKAGHAESSTAATEIETTSVVVVRSTKLEQRVEDAAEISLLPKKGKRKESLPNRNEVRNVTNAKENSEQGTQGIFGSRELVRNAENGTHEIPSSTAATGVREVEVLVATGHEELKVTRRSNGEGSELKGPSRLKEAGRRRRPRKRADIQAAPILEDRNESLQQAEQNITDLALEKGSDFLELNVVSDTDGGEKGEDESSSDGKSESNNNILVKETMHQKQVELRDGLNDTLLHEFQAEDDASSSEGKDQAYSEEKDEMINAGVERTRRRSGQRKEKARQKADRKAVSLAKTEETESGEDTYLDLAQDMPRYNKLEKKTTSKVECQASYPEEKVPDCQHDADGSVTSESSQIEQASMNGKKKSRSSRRRTRKAGSAQPIKSENQLHDISSTKLSSGQRTRAKGIMERVKSRNEILDLCGSELSNDQDDDFITHDTIQGHDTTKDHDALRTLATIEDHDTDSFFVRDQLGHREMGHVSERGQKGLVSNVGETPQEESPQACMLKWVVEAELKPGQKLFVSGASSFLGAWEPMLAVPFTPYHEVGKLNLWEAHTQVPFELNTEFNYFIQVHDEGTTSTVWRPGPSFHLSIPPFNILNDDMVLVKDILDFTVQHKLPVLSWGTWWKDIASPSQLSRPLETESSVLEDVVEKLEEYPEETHKGHSHESSLLRKHSLEAEDATQSSATKVEEFWKHELQEHPSQRLKQHIWKKVLPREEPWLMDSLLLHEKAESSKKAGRSPMEEDQESSHTFIEIDQHVQSPVMVRGKSDVPAEILINSSECTVQRIAILEEGKLVELLLEPVDSEIQVGNVYLGVVKKLLPGMTGVFVDIGSSRIALMPITKNLFPYTFPPIFTSQSNGAVREKFSGSDFHDVEMGTTEKGEHFLEEELLDDREHDEEDVEDDDEEAAEDEEEVEDEVEELTYEETLLAVPIGSALRANGKNEGEDRDDADTAADGVDNSLQSADYVDEGERKSGHQLLRLDRTRPITVNFGRRFAKWRKLEEGMKIIVQVRKEPLGKKGPRVTAFPQLASRFWVLFPRGKPCGVSKKIIGNERKRLKQLAESFKQPDFGLTVRTEAAGQTLEDLEKDLARLIETWKDIQERAEAAAVAAESGDSFAVPVLLHRGMSQTLSIVRDFFVERVQRMVVDTSQTYQEVTGYLEEVAPHLLNRVELYTGRMPIFDAFNLEAEIDKFLSRRVQLPNGGYLLIEETEALVSIDVNGGTGMLDHNTTQSEAILEVNVAAARQIATELRLRDIGGIIVVDFIDMSKPEHENLVFEEMRKAIQRDRSIVNISEISELGLMQMTRRRVRPSVTFMISDPCSCCRGTGRVEALETTLSKIERAILRLLANKLEKSGLGGRAWQKVLLRVDPVMFDYLTKKQRATQLSSALKVYIILKVGRELSRGHFEVSEMKMGAEKRQLVDGQQKTPARKNTRSNTSGKRTWPRVQPVS